METEVVVVGGGPVGLGLAIELGQRGVETVLIERTTRVHDIPKGQNLTQRTMEHFRLWGIETEVREARLMPAGYPTVGVNAYGSLMSDYAHPWFRRSQVDRFYFAVGERLPQYITERILRHRLASLDSVTAIYGDTVVDLEVTNESVIAATERHRRIESRYLVGCDGSHSSVRELAGITETLSEHDRKMVLLVFRSRELHQILEARFGPVAFFNVLHPALDGYWRFLGRVDVGEGWFFHAPVDPASDAANLDYEGLLHESVGEEFELSLDHLGFWDLRIAIADDYRSGPVFIAGDAAHSHPPYGGYGINTGLEDARNLGWKLAAKLQGWGTDRLLDSYAEERRPVFESTARDFIEVFIARDREFIDRHDPGRDLVDFEKAWEQRRLTAGGVGVGRFEPHYEGSSVISGPGDGVSSAIGEHSFVPRAGHHLSPPDAEGPDLFASLGTGFTYISGSSTAAAKLSAAARDLAIPADVVEDHRYTDDVLVRPDHYIGWVGSGTEVDHDGILRRAIGA